MFKRIIREELKIPAEMDYLSDLRDFVTRIGRKYGVAEAVINVFKLAIDEAGTNIIRHAYRDWEGFITLRMIVREQTVIVSLIDQGHTFDPRNVKDPDLQRYVDIGKKGGLGVFIIRKIIDDIDYRKTEEGNELRLSKNRENGKRRKIVLPDVPFNMKTKFFVTATTILSPLIIIVFLFQFLQIAKNIVNAELTEGWTIARLAAHRSADFLREEAHWELATISKEFHDNYSPMVWDVVIVDNEGIIQGEHQLDRLLMPYQNNFNQVSIAEGVNTCVLTAGKSVYEIFMRVDGANPGEILGGIYLLLDKEVIDGQISSEKRKLAITYLVVLLFAQIGVALLIYLTMSPFRKLASWVKDLGQGGSPDEMDFDASDEVGEIAKAFNEITEKFRKSQENVAEQERLQKEMQVAQEIQQTLLPDKFPDIEGYELASYYEAAKEVGGDYYDFVEVDKDTLGIVVADVSGKGVPGSLVMTMIRTALRTEARGNKNAADVLARVNEFVINDMKRGMFVTVFYIILDSKNRTINYASAGHNPMILYRGSTQKSYYLNPRGFPIGISLPDKALFRKSIENDTLRLRMDDVLLIFTDGITEAMNGRRDLFGDERFLEAIRKHGHLGATSLVERLHGELEVFTEGSQQNDDITLVTIKEKMNAEDVLFNRRIRLLNRVNEDGLSVKAACLEAGVSTSTYYKYKKRYEIGGEDGLKEKVGRSEIEEKHISIEDKAKIIDIVRRHPEYGAKRICEELTLDEYGNTKLDNARIYDELVRSRLNTKELRAAFLERGERRQYKQAGTPLLTLDGRIVKNIPRKRAIDEDELYNETSVVEETLLSKESDDSFEAIIEAEEVDAILEDFLDMDEDKHTDYVESFEKDSVYTQDRELKEDIVEVISEVAGDDLQHSPADADDIKIQSDDFDVILDMETGMDDFSFEEDQPGINKKAGVYEVEELPDGDDSEILDFDESLEWDEILEDAVNELTDEEVNDTDEENDEARLDEVLAIDDDEDVFAEIDGDAHIEEKIVSSSIDDLMSEFSEDEEDLDTVDRQGDSSFIDMMEDLGFNRRNMLASQDDLTEETLVVAQPMLDAERIYTEGMNHYQEQNYREAIYEFEKVLKITPHDGSAFQCLGDAHFRLGEMIEARSAYEEARTLLPENVNVLENLGVIFANMGQYKKAVWQWGEVLKLHPDRTDIIERIKKMQRMIRQRYL
ncbi:SpoIIE family protein phosphatase [bacterium]|nr:SpoIIE family protein phosphatase [bacterium]